MREPKKMSFWKKGIWLLVKIYAGFCTLLITVYFIFAICDSLTERPADPEKCWMLSSYDYYLANEYPKRGPRFQQLAGLLAQYGSKSSSVFAVGVLQYLGDPDYVYGDSNRTMYVYSFQQGYLTTNQWCFMANFSGGKLLNGGINCYAGHPQKSPRPKPR